MLSRFVGEWSWWRALRLLLVAYGTLCAYGLFLSERQIFMPPSVSYVGDPDVFKIPVLAGLGDASTDAAASEAIAAMYYPNPSSPYVVLYSHGNGEDLGWARPLAEKIQSAGFSVLAYDYRGYGLSDGKRPSEKRAYQDIEAAYRYLTSDRKIAPENIIVYGRSVGGGPSVYLAAQQPVGGLIIESSFVSTFRVVTRAKILPFDKFPNLARIDRVTAPVLIMHGVADEVIPFWHGERLYEAVRSPKQFFPLEGAGHNNFVDVAGDRYIQALQDFKQLLQ